jgi:imidazolonepropionase
VPCDLLIKNIKGLVQVRAQGLHKVAGSEMASLPKIFNGYLKISQGLILDYGKMDELTDSSAHEVIDATNRFVFPSFVDSHTHLVFAASREEEFVMKIKGSSYEEIASKGGGILNSAQKLQIMSEDELFEKSLPRAHEIIATGTGVVEIKSGYGLTVVDELKMLRVAKRIGRETDLTVKTTLLGAHAIPAGVKKEDYISLIINEMIPAAAEAQLADYIDVFCEKGFFNPDETERIVDAGKKYGLKSRLHANQLHRSGGVQVGVKTNAISVDHLENIGEEEIELLKQSNTMPTVLPAAAFFLGLPFPPVRTMLDAGLAVAIASDYNPGSSPTGNIPLIISLACIKMKMTPEEAFNACSINTAYALELQDSYGSITKGKVASIFITKPIPSIEFIPYAFGTNSIETVILNGRIVSKGNTNQ